MWRDVAGAFAFLTIIPAHVELKQPGRIFAYFPLVGLAIGAMLYGVASIDFLAADVVAFLTLLVWVLATGGLHLDGFADSCDGLLATATPERRLEIMKDVHAGSWAVVGVALLLLGKWVALHHVSAEALILPPLIGRWTMVVAAWGFPYGRAEGTGGYFRQGLGRVQVIIATLTTLTVGFAFGLPEGVVLLLGPGVVIIVGGFAMQRLGGGITGDVYGAMCELTEWTALLVLGAM